MGNSLKRFFTLGFDRAFSGRGRKQFAWLVGILLLFFCVIYLVSWFFSFPEPSDVATPDSQHGASGSDVPMGRLLQLICLFIDPGSVANVTPELRWFSLGVAILGLLLGLNYYVKQSQYHVFGVTTIIIALITYCIAPIVATQPSWFYVMVIVTVLLFTELKHTFTELAQRMKNDEMITLAKFLAISGIILPMLPNENLIPGINLTPYSIWLATVVVSGISYLSYLLKRYVFHESGILVSGIVGGLYSSTATISVLARKSRKASVQDAPEYVAAMLLAVSMMFLRFLILIGIFSRETLLAIYPYLLIMSVVTAAVAWYLHSKRKRVDDGTQTTEDEDSSNPLEFKVALIFAMLFVVFTILTHYTLVYAGTGGLNLLSFISGFSDITPFILNLLQGTGSVAVLVITACSMQAIVSNIAVNMCYALFFAGGKSPLRPWILGGFGSVIAANICLLLFFYFL